MRFLTSVTLSLLFLTIPAVSQQQPSQPPRGSIEGIVTRADNGQPVAGAQVTLTALNPLAVAILSGADPTAILANTAPQTPPPQIPPVNTDSEGKFFFKGLAAGAYRAIVAANGFVRQEYGQRAPNTQGTTITITDQVLKDLAIRLTPAGTVSGRILDEFGQPALGIPVQLLRPAYNVQGRNYQAMGTATANDRGEYRLFGITPGRYYLNIGNAPARCGGRWARQGLGRRLPHPMPSVSSRAFPI